MNEANKVVVNSTSPVSQSSSSDTITIKKDTLWKYSTFILAAILIVGAFVFFMDKDNGNTAPTGNVVNNPGQQLPEQNARVEVDADDDAVIGDKNAPVEIIEFSDYECPFCQRHYQQTYGQIKKDYIDTGKVKYALRDFPLSFHQQAQKAAEAAECAGELGGDEAYFKMHDKLFGEGVAKGVEGFKAYAKAIGLDTKKFNDCLDSGKMSSEVAKDISDGGAAGVQGTPAFFINGKLLSGAQPFSAFKQAIDAELSG